MHSRAALNWPDRNDEHRAGALQGKLGPETSSSSAAWAQNLVGLLTPDGFYQFILTETLSKWDWCGCGDSQTGELRQRDLSHR